MEEEIINVKNTNNGQIIRVKIQGSEQQYNIKEYIQYKLANVSQLLSIYNTNMYKLNQENVTLNIDIANEKGKLMKNHRMTPKQLQTVFSNIRSNIDIARLKKNINTSTIDIATLKKNINISSIKFYKKITYNLDMYIKNIRKIIDDKFNIYYFDNSIKNNVSRKATMDDIYDLQKKWRLNEVTMLEFIRNNENDKENINSDNVETIKAKFEKIHTNNFLKMIEPNSIPIYTPVNPNFSSRIPMSNADELSLPYIRGNHSKMRQLFNPLHNSNNSSDPDEGVELLTGGKRKKYKTKRRVYKRSYKKSTNKGTKRKKY